MFDRFIASRIKFTCCLVMAQASAHADPVSLAFAGGSQATQECFWRALALAHFCPGGPCLNFVVQGGQGANLTRLLPQSEVSAGSKPAEGALLPDLLSHADFAAPARHGCTCECSGWLRKECSCSWCSSAAAFDAQFDDIIADVLTVQHTHTCIALCTWCCCSCTHQPPVAAVNSRADTLHVHVMP
jgi:hypothetical protein